MATNSRDMTPKPVGVEKSSALYQQWVVTKGATSEDDEVRAAPLGTSLEDVMHWTPKLTGAGALFPKQGSVGIVIEDDNAEHWLLDWEDSNTAPVGLVGVPLPWLVAAVPTGYIEFAGQSIDPVTQPKLAALFGATMPDLRNKMFLGASATHPLGSTGGEETHTLTTPEIPSHVHPSPVAGQSYATSVGAAAVSGAGADLFPVSSRAANSGAAGGGGGHNNLPPFFAAKWITLNG